MQQQEENNTTAQLTTANIAQVLMEEDLQRELARNQAANRMAQEREIQALAARKRAEESQKLMKDMLAKYEQMKEKLDSTKQHLEETNTKIVVQEKLTDKIQKMKERVEQYTSKREAVSCLNEHVNMKADLCSQDRGSEGEQGGAGTSQDMPDAVEISPDLVDRLKSHCEENEARLQKREELKAHLEQQLERGEKRAEEQTRIAQAREELLELKLRELRLQQQRLARRREQQRRAEEDNSSFLAGIDRELEEMEKKTEEKVSKEVQLKQLQEQRIKLEKCRTMRLELEAARAKTQQLERMVQEKREAIEGREAAAAAVGVNKTVAAAVVEFIPEVPAKPEELSLEGETKVEEVCQASGESTSSAEVERKEEDATGGAIPKQQQQTSTVKTSKKSRKSRSRQNSATGAAAAVQLPPAVDSPQQPPNGVESGPATTPVRASTVPPRVLSPDPVTAAATTSTSKSVTATPRRVLSPEPVIPEVAADSEQHADISQAVRRIEGKCASVKGDLAGMAMSEQYLRTKQALLLAKKKEQEMSIAENIAKIREAEVGKMREKVEHMQELLRQRKEKLKLQEEMMKEKKMAEEGLAKYIETKKRREAYCQKELMERIVFDKEPPKKK